MLVWGITDGSAGTIAQVKALAAALGAVPVMKTVQIRKPYIWLPNAAYNGALQKILPQALNTYDAIAAPWPDVIISCGRRGALAALAVKRIVILNAVKNLKKDPSPSAQDDKKPRLIHIHAPQMSARHFDSIIAMQHDKIEASNVIKTRFALHNITPETLSTAKEKYAKRFINYAKPYVAVLLGGSTNKYVLNKARMQDVITALQQLTGAISGSLLITTSRRTGYDNVQALLQAFPRMRDAKAYVYDGIGENPYLGMLALAEHIVVTNDSVNMMSEAMATGKPVYIVRLPGHSDTKPARFADMLIADGIARPFDGKLETWNYKGSDEMEKLVEEIRIFLPLQGGGQ